jgi:hypothetical protein
MPRRFLSGLSASNRVVAAVNPEASTTPVSNNRDGVQLPEPRATENTSKVAASAPPKAAKFTTVAPKPSIITASAATAAPPEVPRM